MQDVFGSKRFWLAVAGVVGVVVQSLFPMVDQETVTGIVMLIAAWIVGDSIRATDPTKQYPR